MSTWKLHFRSLEESFDIIIQKVTVDECLEDRSDLDDGFRLPFADQFPNPSQDVKQPIHSHKENRGKIASDSSQNEKVQKTMLS
jgi:hypothetical protein